MSGHSHYATIRRQKEAKDAQKGRIFSKLARAISIAARMGGVDPDSNYKLRMAIEQARAANMPKENIERAISRGVGEGEVLEEVTYEGFGPGGIAVFVEAATDNRNRTAQEIKNLFERGGGNLAGPGAVSFNFEPKGLIVVKKEDNTEEQMLKLIDLQVDDLQEVEDAIEVYVSSDRLSEVRDKIQNLGFSIISFELIKKPKSLVTINEVDIAQKALRFLEGIENHADVQKVFTNLDIPDEVLKKLTI